MGQQAEAGTGKQLRQFRFDKRRLANPDTAPSTAFIKWGNETRPNALAIGSLSLCINLTNLLNVNTTRVIYICQ